MTIPTDNPAGRAPAWRASEPEPGGDSLPGMRWHPDHLARMLCVPYVPTLGPVHPAALSPTLFGAVAAVAGTGRFLPHDPDQRWSATKDEQVLPDRIHQGPEQVIVPTLRHRAGGTITMYHYQPIPPELPSALEVAAMLRSTYQVATGRVVWFGPDPAGDKPADATPGTRRTRVLLKNFDHTTPLDPVPEQVVDLDSSTPQVRASFASFATAMAGEGFGFLHTRWQAGMVDGPILVAVADHQVVGAIGPLRILPDPVGALRLLPQYLAVLPTHRSRGHGRALWRTAARWGQFNGAAYQLLQAVVDGASDRMFLTEGLTSLGFVCQATT